MARKWIQKAIKHPGSLRAAAKHAGALKRDGTIDAAWLRAMAKRNDKMGARARLALKLIRMRKGAKK